VGIAEKIREHALQFVRQETDPVALRELIEKRANAEFWNAEEQEKVKFLTKVLEGDLGFAVELADALGWEQPQEDSARLAAEALRAAGEDRDIDDADLARQLNWKQWKLEPDLPGLQRWFEQDEPLRRAYACFTGLRPGRVHLREVAGQAIAHAANNGSPSDPVRKCLERHLLSWNALRVDPKHPAFLRALQENFAFRQEVARITVYLGEEAKELASLAIEMLRVMPARLKIDVAIKGAVAAVNVVRSLTGEAAKPLRMRAPREWVGFSRSRLVEDLDSGDDGEPRTKLAQLLSSLGRDPDKHAWEETESKLAQMFACHPALPLLLWKEAEWPYPFSLVLREELMEIEARRAKMQAPATAPLAASQQEEKPLAEAASAAGEPQTESAIDVSDLAADMGLTGVAFSGGGIRSATFNLGVLQKLAEFGLLRRIDYLSTVSGGGYIGSWLAGWIRDRKFAHVEASLSPKTSPDPRNQAVKPIQFLRAFSNYLTPRVGAFSFDTWTMVAVYVRNVLLNQATLFALLGTVLLIPRFVALPMYLQSKGENWTLYVAIGLAATAIIGMAWNMHRATAVAGGKATTATQSAGNPDTADAGDRRRAETRSWLYGPVGIQMTVVSCMLFAVYCGSLWFWRNVDVAIYPLNRTHFPWWIAFCIFMALAATLAIGGGFWQSFGRRLKGDPGRFFLWRSVVTVVVVVGGAGANLGLLWVYAGVMHWLRGVKNDAGLWNAEMWGPILLLMVFVLPGILQTGLMGVDFPDSGREWMSRFRAVCIVYTLMWIGVMSAAIYGPLLVFRSAVHAKAWLAGVSFTWVVTTVGSFLAGKSAQTGVDKEGKPKVSALQILAKAGPPVFVAGLLVLIATGEQILLVWRSWPASQPLSFAELSDHHFLMLNPWMGLHSWWGVLMKVAAAHVAVALVLAWRVDINEFSMHNFYRNRLVRCYLGASHQERKANPFTGFDDTDDFPLSTLTAKEADAEQGAYEGPYPILNSTLNLSTGEPLAWQERKATSFMFSPCFCGFDPATMNGADGHVTNSPADIRLRPCAYRRTPFYSRQQGPSLGTAFSISGAAANPNQGYNTSAAVAFLMTVFNVRLGWWLGNPRRDKESERPSPRFGLAALVSELLGRADDRTHFVNLSDGGHFDNMGIYELVRRRCAHIILCDAEQDSSYKFGGLGMAIRKCRIDFGARIDIDPSRIVPNPDTGRSETHCAVGTIDYLDGSRGTLVYIKSSVTGDEPEDVLQYRASQAQFPHQTTADQWFDESQFESYRALGYHAADQTLSPSESWHPWTSTMDSVKPLFTALGDHWYRLNPKLRGTASKHTATLARLLDTLRKNPGLQHLGGQLFPNSGIPPAETARNTVEEFYFCMALIQLVEDIYFEFELERKEWFEDPRIGGWRHLFRTWKDVPIVAATWAAEYKTFREDFQRFWNDTIQTGRTG